MSKKLSETDQSKRNPDEVLKKKARAISANSALVSIIVHVVLIIAAGSWVAVKYVQKKKAELTAYTAPPKMERRQLSSPVQKMDRVKQSSNRPKLVSSRTAITGSEFALPSSAAVGGKVSTQKFTSPFSGSGRDFSMLTKGLTFEIPNFKFLGVRGSGEKVAFIIEATSEMFREPATCAHIESELKKVLSEMSSSTVFNVFLYNEGKLELFKPEMSAVTESNVSELSDWLSSHFRAPLASGNYEISKVYDTAIGDEAQCWTLAMQSAMEQCADSIFVVSRDWGFHSLGPEKGRTLVEFSLWEFLGVTNERDVDDVFEQDRMMRDAYLVDAVDLIEADEKRRESNDLPRQFIPSFVDFMQYSRDQVLSHIETVCSENYAAINQPPPQVNFVRVVSSKDLRSSDSSTSNIRELTRVYNGEFGTLNSDRFRAANAQNAAVAKLKFAADSSSENVAKKLSFFGKTVETSRLGLVVDLSSNVRDSDFSDENTLDWLCGEVVKLAEKANEFNVFAVTDLGVLSFGNSDKIDGLADWLNGVCAGSVSNFVEVTNYDSAIGSDIGGVPLAIQSALQERVDTILVVGDGLGGLPICREKAERLIEYEVFHLLGSEGSIQGDKIGDLIDGESVGMLAPIDEMTDLWVEVVKSTMERMENDNSLRKSSGDELGFVRDFYAFIEYLPIQFAEHLQLVADQFYGENLPEINFAKLIKKGTESERSHLDEFGEVEKVFECNVNLISAPNAKDSDVSELADFRALPKRKYLGMPQVRFLGSRAQGQKVAFIIDASKSMWWKRYGALSLEHLKSEFVKTFEKLPESFQFNVILFDRDTLFEFAPGFTAASESKKGELKTWIDTNLNFEALGLAPELNNYTPLKEYDTKSSGWVLAMRSALENRADTIFILGDNWGRHDVGREKGQEMIDFSMWELLGGDSSDESIAELDVFEKDRQYRDDCLVNTVEMIAGLPPFARDPFMHDLLDYTQFTSDQVISNLKQICVDNYLAEGQGAPLVNWVRLVQESDVGKIDAASRNMRKLAKEFGGEFSDLNGTAIHEKLAPKAVATSDEKSEVEEEAEESGFKFFGTSVESKSVAFILDVSDVMFADKFGNGVSFDFAKDQIAKIVGELEPGTVINLFAADSSRAVSFAESMVSDFDAASVSRWLGSIQEGLENPEGFDLQKTDYPSVIGADICGLPLAIQCAIEQHAETILVVESDLGKIRVPREKSRRMLDFAILKKLGAREESKDVDLNDDELEGAVTSAMVAPLKVDQAQYGSLVAQARLLVGTENEDREEQGLSLGFVRDVYDYFSYTPMHILSHLQVVAKEVQLAQKSELEQMLAETETSEDADAEMESVTFPQIHFAKFVDPKNKKNRAELRSYRSFKRPFKSEVKAVRGATSEADFQSLNLDLDLY